MPHYQAGQSASSPWQPYLNDSLSTNPSTLRFTCGGTPFATDGTAVIEAENVAARTWNCKIYSFVRWPRFSQLILGYVREPLFMAWVSSIIPIRKIYLSGTTT